MEALKAYALVGYTQNRISEYFENHEALDAWVEEQEKYWHEHGGFQLFEVFKVQRPDPKPKIADTGICQFDENAHYCDTHYGDEPELYVVCHRDVRVGNCRVHYKTPGGRHRVCDFSLYSYVKADKDKQLRGDDLAFAVAEYFRKFYGKDCYLY